MHNFDWEIEGRSGEKMKNLVKVDLKVKFWNRMFLTGTLKRFLSLVCHFSEWKVRGTMSSVFINKALCVNLGRVEKYIVFIFFWFLNSIALSILAWKRYFLRIWEHYRNMHQGTVQNAASHVRPPPKPNGFLS